jgi:uncharacterized protein DUF4031
MAILIDSFYNGARGPIRYWLRICGHLVSDTSLEELHLFAESLGLHREWFQEKSIPHYDLTGKVYELALERGATLVSSREIVLRAVRMDGKPKIRFGRN